MKWYQKYLSIYGKALSDIPDGTILQIRNQLQSLQSDDPEVSVVVIAHIMKDRDLPHAYGR